MVELFFNRIILRIPHMTPDCTRRRVPMFFFQRRVTRKTTSSRATETCAYIAKKTKTNPRVEASKSELCLRGAFIWLCIIQSSAQRQRDRAVIFLLILLMTLWVGTLTIAKEKCVCMCITMNSCPAMCGLCFIGCEFSSGNLITMLCIPLDFLFFFISLYMCIILVFRVCTWIFNVNYFTFWFSPWLHGIIREFWCRHDYFSSFMLIILFERLSSLLFAWIILSQLWNTQRNYVLYEKIISLNFVRVFYLNWEYWSFHADWQSCITCSSCGAQPNFLILKQEWSIFTVYYIIEIDYLIILYKF